MLHAWLVASPLHWPWIKNRRVGDIVALIDAALTQARRVGSNPAITPAPVTAAAAAPSGGAAFSSTDGAARGRSIRAASITHPNSACFSSLRRVPLERWKGRWRFGIAWIGDDVVDHLVANNKAIRIGDRVILAMVPSDASRR